MERLLKIVEGPMRGAEIALVAGTRVKAGSGDECDIIIADTSLDANAFELDVSEDAVVLVLPDGATEELEDFTVRTFGSTGIAVGPAEGAWGELKRPSEHPEPEEEKPAADETAPADGAAEEEPKAADGAAESAPAAVPCWKDRRRMAWAGGILAVALLLLAILLFFLFPYPFRSGGDAVADAVVEVRDPTLAEIASEHGLKLDEENGRPRLSGNLRLRTERLAIRALALAADRTVALDLTDDQSLRMAAESSFAASTGGRLKADSVSNRVLTVSGEIPSAAALAYVLKALDEDVPKLERCDTSRVRTPAVVVADPVAKDETPVRAETPSLPAPMPVAPAPVEVRVVEKPAVPAYDFPVAGILVAPYPCVVLKDGRRCMEGAVIGGARLKSIRAEELVFEGAAGELRWRP